MEREDLLKGGVEEVLEGDCSYTSSDWHDLGEEELEEYGTGTYLSVTQGSGTLPAMAKQSRGQDMILAGPPLAQKAPSPEPRRSLRLKLQAGEESIQIKAIQGAKKK